MLPKIPRDVNVRNANSGRIYVEELHLHPLRLYLTFTQEGLEWNPVTEGLVIFQLIRGMASIADAPLIFTSFVVSKAFESPSTLIGIILAHYSSQLSSQILSILGSLVILKAPADILSNVGTGVRDFFVSNVDVSILLHDTGFLYLTEHFLSASVRTHIWFSSRPCSIHRGIGDRNV